MPFLSYTKGFGNFMEVLLRDHRRYLPIVEFLDKVTQDLSELTWSECELIFTEISRANGAEFCAGIHAGVSKALNDSLPRKDKLQAILVFARKLNMAANSITDSDVQTIRDAGWSEQTVEDVVGLVAIINVYTILDNGLGFGAVPNKVFEEMGRATVQLKGYAPVFRSFITDEARETSNV